LFEASGLGLFLGDLHHADIRLTCFFMMIFREIAIWVCQGVLFCLMFGTAGLAAHLGGALLASAFDINDAIPAAFIYFGAVAVMGWLGDRFLPETWLPNPLL